jgi:hypothetical protein
MVGQRGAVAAGPDGSCAVLYNRLPTVQPAGYSLTVFDSSFARQWTVTVPAVPRFNLPLQLLPLRNGYLVRTGQLLAEYDWSGNLKWSESETSMTVQINLVPNRGEFFLLRYDVGKREGLHVLASGHASLTAHEP